MSELSRRLLTRRSLLLGGVGVGAGAWIGLQPWVSAQAQPPEKPELPGPDPIPEANLAPVLKTIPVPRKPPEFNQIAVNSAVLPSDTRGIWVLDFLYKPVRTRIVEVPGKGRRAVHYLWYRVVNRTGEPRLFVPQFTLVTDTGKTYNDVVMPAVLPIIQTREGGTPLLSTVTAVGMIPPSSSPKVDDAIFGVALWDEVDPNADAFKIYIRGLSDGYKTEGDPNQDTTRVKYKTLRLDFTCFGDDRIREREIVMLDPPFEWIYW